MLLTNRLRIYMQSASDSTDRSSKKFFVGEPSSISPDVNAKLDAVVLKALDKGPSRRFLRAPHLLSARERWSPSECRECRQSFQSTDEPSKPALGLAPPSNAAEAQDYSRRAFEARTGGRLSQMADLPDERGV
jgi:hypothetical protein